MIRIRLQTAVLKGLAEKFGRFNIRKVVTREDCETIGAFAIVEIKQLISRGISPIEGMGKFPAYKWQTKAIGKLGKEKYPLNAVGRKHGKSVTPVNLKLTGDFLNALTNWAEASSGVWAIVIGFPESDSVSIAKEKGHRDGANGQPRRPILPRGRERWAANVQRVILNGLKYAITKKMKDLG